MSSAKNWIIVPEDRDEQPVRTFTCFNADREAIADRLKKYSNHTVVINQPVVWIPLHQLLKRHRLEVNLVNARHLKNVLRSETDVPACQWLQRLHTYGLLSGCL